MLRSTPDSEAHLPVIAAPTGATQYLGHLVTGVEIFHFFYSGFFYRFMRYMDTEFIYWAPGPCL